jgi:hypothetical protein
MGFAQLSRVRTFEEVPDPHQFIDLRDILVAVGLHDQRVPVSRHFQFSIRFLFDFGDLAQHGAKVPPFEIVRRRVLEDRLIGPQVSSSELWLHCHVSFSKKTDVAEHPQVFDHVGLLVNGLPGAARLPFI